MDIFITLRVSLLLAIFLPSSQATTNVPYRAAVYEHAVLSAPAKIVSREEAVKNMMKNIRIYELQAQIAASKVSDHLNIQLFLSILNNQNQWVWLFVGMSEVDRSLVE